MATQKATKTYVDGAVAAAGSSWGAWVPFTPAFANGTAGNTSGGVDNLYNFTVPSANSSIPTPRYRKAADGRVEVLFSGDLTNTITGGVAWKTLSFGQLPVEIRPSYLGVREQASAYYGLPNLKTATGSMGLTNPTPMNTNCFWSIDESGTVGVYATATPFLGNLPDSSTRVCIAVLSYRI